MDKFKKASKIGLRFDSSRGALTIEDLWVVPLNSNNGFNLEQIAQTAHTELEALGVKSFTGKSTEKNEVAELRMEIIKEVIADRLAEIEAKNNAKVNEARIAKLKQIQRDRKDQADEQLSDEDIEKELAALQS